MMIKYSALLFLFITSCGLRETSEQYDNPLIGTWSLSYYYCSDNFLDTTSKEDYLMTDATDIQVIFNGNKISYSSVGVCTTSSQGIYSVSYDNTTSGTLDIGNVVTGGTTCSESIADRGDSGVGVVEVPTTMDGVNTNNRNWFIDKSNTTLYIENFTNFSGSSNILVCNGDCVCRGVFNK